MKFLRIIVLLLLAIQTSYVYAQELRGEVLNEISQPLESAYIFNINSQSHAHTLENGVFALENSKPGDSIRIGLLGYRTKIVVLETSSFESKLTIVLEEKIFQLEEMVITEELNALSTITRLDINTNPVNSSQEVLSLIHI